MGENNSFFDPLDPWDPATGPDGGRGDGGGGDGDGDGKMGCLLLVFVSAATALETGAACTSTIAKDSSTAGCQAFCEAGSAKKHCSCCKCKACFSPLMSGFMASHGGFSYIEQDGEPYHTPCHRAKFGAKCAACSGLLEDKFLLAEGQKYHAHCFVCAECAGPLHGGYLLGRERQFLCGKPCGRGR